MKVIQWFQWIIFLVCIGNIDVQVEAKKIPRIEYFNVGVMYPISNKAVTVPNIQGIEFGSAVLMAIREINDKTDGIEDELLPDTVLRPVVRTPYRSFAYGAVKATEMVTVDHNEGVIACIGPALAIPLSGL